MSLNVGLQKQDSKANETASFNFLLNNISFSLWLDSPCLYGSELSQQTLSGVGCHQPEGPWRAPPGSTDRSVHDNPYHLLTQEIRENFPNS